MSGRGEQLHATPDDQLGELIDLIATLDDTTLRLPCPGREKLGDGTIAASAQHAVDNYQRIADFVQTSDRMTRTSEPNGRGGHRVPRFLKPSATTRQTTPNTATTQAPVHTTTSTPPTTPISPPYANRSEPPASVSS